MLQKDNKFSYFIPCVTQSSSGVYEAKLTNCLQHASSIFNSVLLPIEAVSIHALYVSIVGKVITPIDMHGSLHPLGSHSSMNIILHIACN